MDVFKFKINPSTPTKLEKGELIHDISSKLWVERYRDPGEFKFTAPLSSGLKDVLPLGTFISHMNTLEVMIVENHQVEDDINSDSIISVSGRSAESFLENRVVGANLNPGAAYSPTLPEYTLASAQTHIQAREMVNDHIVLADVYDDNDALVNMIAQVSTLGVYSGASESRVIKRGDLHKRLVELLAIDDLGVRMLRPSSLVTKWGQAHNENTRFLIHTGEDKSTEIVFSWAIGDISNAEYLWSLKNLKTDALVTSRFVEHRVVTTKSNMNKRFMHVDASDLDEHLSQGPAEGAALTTLRAKMTTRANTAIAAQREVEITKADISDTSKHEYRKDYDIGDLVALDGNFGATAIKRVTEFVEVEDSEGERGYPTLSSLDA